jgi:hypothetical protein
MEGNGSGVPCRHVICVLQNTVPQEQRNKMLAKQFHPRWSLQGNLSTQTLRKIFNYHVSVCVW